MAGFSLRSQIVPLGLMGKSSGVNCVKVSFDAFKIAKDKARLSVAQRCSGRGFASGGLDTDYLRRSRTRSLARSTTRYLSRKEVDHHSLREQIVKDAPELAGEKKVLSDDIPKTVSVHLDGVDREAIIHMVTKAMREGGASECEIEGFKDDVNTADLATLLAKAIAWGAPVQFLKDGQPWISGDWRRLSLWQRLKRRFLLLRGSYVHPDGTFELASEDRS